MLCGAMLSARGTGSERHWWPQGCAAVTEVIVPLIPGFGAVPQDVSCQVHGVGAAAALQGSESQYPKATHNVPKKLALCIPAAQPRFSAPGASWAANASSLLARYTAFTISFKAGKCFKAKKMLC